MQAIPESVRTSVNQRVLAQLQGASAHSDIAESLVLAVKPLGDVQVYCAKAEAYGYVITCTRGVIFGLATGMHTVAFRLEPRWQSRALATGGVACPEYGKEWVAVLHGRPDDDWPKVDVEFWARKAYVFARQVGDLELLS